MAVLFVEPIREKEASSKRSNAVFFVSKEILSVPRATATSIPVHCDGPVYRNFTYLIL